MSKWEFDCPQFVDFSAGLECGYAHDDVFNGSLNDNQTVRSTKAFVPKMATPKIKSIKSLKNSPFVNISRPVATDDEKMAVLGKLTSRLSRSEGCLNKDCEVTKTPEKNLALETLQKRRLSGSCIKKKRICPTTPICLKRTLISKQKKAKTTLELELERIAELQNEMQQHLRLNRMNLRRQKVNKAPFPFKSLSRKNSIKAAPLKSKESESVKIPSQPFIQSDDRKLRCLSDKTCDNMPFCKEQEANTNKGKQDNVRATSAKALRDLNGIDKALKSRVLFETFKGHGGLNLISKQTETVPESFSFDKSLSFNKSRHTINTLASASTVTPKCLDNKENLVK